MLALALSTLPNRGNVMSLNKLVIILNVVAATGLIVAIWGALK